MSEEKSSLPTKLRASTTLVSSGVGVKIPAAEQMSLDSIWSALQRRWLLVLVTVLLTTGLGIGYLLFFYKPLYESEAQLVVSTDRIQTTVNRSDEFSMLSDLVQLAKRRSVMGQINVIKSPDLIFEVTQRLGGDVIAKGYAVNPNTPAIYLPDWAVEVTSPKDSDLIVIKAKAYDGEVAANVANTVARTYLERDLGFTTDAAKQGRVYVGEEMNKVQKQLAKAKAELAQFKKKTNLVTAASQMETLSGSYQSTRVEKERAQVEADAARRQVESLGRELRAQGNKIDDSQTLQSNPQYQQTLTRLSELNAKRAKLLQDYTPQSPEVTSVTGQIEAAELELQKTAENIIGSSVSVRNPLLTAYLEAQVASAAADARYRSLNAVLSERSGELIKLPDAERDLTRLQQEVSVLEQVYAMLNQKYYQLLVNEKSTMQSSLFVSTARPPLAPVYTRKQLAGVVLAAAIVLAFCAVALAERIDHRVRDNNDISRAIGELPLSVIPKQPKLAEEDVFSGNLDADTPFAEAFRILRNNIVFAQPGKPIKMLAITSPGRADGKSTVSANLAASMAMDGKRVLLVDCNLRCPSIHKRLNMDRSIGLTSVVDVEVAMEDAVLTTNINGLWVLLSGAFPGNPAEFLNSKECRKALSNLRDKYDIVIADCPPCAGLSDMQILATLSDGVLLVVSLGTTREDTLDSTIQTLALVNAPFLGYVTNNVSVRRLGYDYYGCPRSTD